MEKNIDVVNLIVRKETALNLIEAKGSVWHLFFFLYSFHQCFFIFETERQQQGVGMDQKSPTW